MDALHPGALLGPARAGAGRSEGAARVAGAHLVPYQVTPDIRSALVERYGAAGEKVRRAEAFELYEYARQPATEELRELFPF